MYKYNPSQTRECHFRPSKWCGLQMRDVKILIASEILPLPFVDGWKSRAEKHGRTEGGGADLKVALSFPQTTARPHVCVESGACTDTCKHTHTHVHTRRRVQTPTHTRINTHMYATPQSSALAAFFSSFSLPPPPFPRNLSLHEK